jgi:hypothetical protein
VGLITELFALSLNFERLVANIKLCTSAKNANNQLFVLLFGVDPYIFTIFKHQLHGF